MNSQSLHNSTIAPGWQPDEVEILKIALMKFGIGRWKKIMQSGILPGKTSAQLSSQTQRLLGQQSLSEYLHLHLDIDKVSRYNQTKTGVLRKGNCIINTGNNPDPVELERMREYNQQNFGISTEQARSLKIPAISALSRIMSVKQTPLTRLIQLHDLQNSLQQRLKKAKRSRK